MGKSISIWLEDGRQVVCHPLEENHPLRASRTGLRCKVMKTDGERGHSHVYYDETPFHKGRCHGSPTIFYQKNIWWRSHVHLKGWSFSFTPPRAEILRDEIRDMERALKDTYNEFNRVTEKIRQHLHILKVELNSLE